MRVKILVEHLIKGINTVRISKLQKKWMMQRLASFMGVFHLHEFHFFFNAKNQCEEFFQLGIFCKLIFYICINRFCPLYGVEATCKKDWLMGT